MISQKKINLWKQNFHTPVARQEATPEELTQLRLALEKQGMNASKLYQRLQYIGFDEWEMNGIDNCIEQFVQAVNEKRSEENHRHPDETPVPSLTFRTDMPPIEWWCLFGEEGLSWQFCCFMEQFGMNRKTAKARFETNRFEPWELNGINNIYTQLSQ